MLAQHRRFVEGLVEPVKANAPSALLGKGIYTVPDASRLTRVSQRRIRYWLKGFSSEKVAESHDRRVWHGELAPIDDKLALGFLDLHEVRFIDAFLRTGVSWKLLRKAHNRARDRYHTEHPFCTRRFVTDGSEILEELATDDGTAFQLNSPVISESPWVREVSFEEVAYEEVIHGQRVFPEVIQPFLRELEFADNDRLIRWWPLGIDRAVVLDPKRQFGQPIAARSGVPTEVFYAAAKAGQAVEEIAEWYEVDVQSVRDAIEFEEKLAA